MDIQIIKNNDYSSIAEVRGHDIVFYCEYGSYQGQWLLVSYDKSAQVIYLWKGWYGSCSGCDDLEARVNHTDVYRLSDGTLTLGWKRGNEDAVHVGYNREDFVEFANDYHPYITVDLETWLFIVESDERLVTVIPANERYDYEPVEAVVKSVQEAWSVFRQSPYNLKEK